MPLNRAAVMTYVEKHWFRPCDDGQIFNDFGTVHVAEARHRLQQQGKLPGSPADWDAVIIPDVDASNRVIPEKERACFIRKNPSGVEIPVPTGSAPPQLAGKFDVVPFSQHKGAHDGFEDCAHYLSRCLTAGGIAINQTGVPGLVQELQQGRHTNATRTLGEKVTRDQGDRIMRTGILDRGDVIGYFHPNGYSHSTIYTGPQNGIHRITCHSRSRFQAFFDNAEWFIQADLFRFTLIHFANELLFLPIQLTKLKRCEVKAGGLTEFYQFLPKGHVDRNRRGPNAPAGGVPPADKGYWFTKQLDLFVFWPRTGQVVRANLANLFLPIDFSGSSSSINITIDDRPATLRPLG